MSTRAYSPRRYGRSEHAPIVIDMVDYGSEEDVDEFSYSYSSPRHTTTSAHSGLRLAASMGAHPSSNSPRHTNDNSSRRSEGGSRSRHISTPVSSNKSSPRYPTHDSNSNSNSNRHSSASSLHSASTSPRQSVHMHNFAQRRSFMMGGFEKAAASQYSPHNKGAGYSEYVDDNDASLKSEYRESPGRSRAYQPTNESDARDISVAVDSVNRRGTAARHHHHQQQQQQQLHQQDQHHYRHDKDTDDGAVYGITIAGNRFDKRQYSQPTEAESKREATFPVFAQAKRPGKAFFTFDNDDHHTVSGVMNHSLHDVESSPPDRDSKSVAAPASDKKVFYFDIDDLSQRLLNSGDQDLSRRLRKKKSKNARSRISRNRAKRKSKKSVFNLDLGDATAGALGSGARTDTTATYTVNATAHEDYIGHRGARFESEIVINGKDRLYNATSADIGIAIPDATSQGNNSTVSRTEDNSAMLRQSPSVRLPPAENNRDTALSTKNITKFETESMHPEKVTSTPTINSATSPIVTSSPRDQLSPRLEDPGNPRSPKQNEDIGSATGEESDKTEIVNRPVRGGSTEIRVTKVYDKINDRLDHIVNHENDVENRQKAIRAVFEEVQQHVADLRKHKQPASPKTHGPDIDRRDDVVDLAITSDTPKRSIADNGDDQIIKCCNESTESEDNDTSPIQTQNSPSRILSDQPISTSQQEIVEGPNLSHGVTGPTVDPTASQGKQSILYLDLSDKPNEEDQDGEDLHIEGDGAKSQETRPSAYLSSDNSGDDEVVVQKVSVDKGDTEVYVIEEKFGHGAGHLDKRTANTKPGPQDQEAARLDPDGDRLEPDATDEAENSDDGQALVGHGSKSKEIVRTQARCVERLDSVGLGDSDDDGAVVDIDKEFDRVVPVSDSEFPDSVDYDIAETLDRVARQSEIRKEIHEETTSQKNGDEKAGTLMDTFSNGSLFSKMPKKDEEEKPNALLETLSNGSLLSNKDGTMIPHSMSNRTRGNQAQSPRQVGESSSSVIESFIDVDGDIEDAAKKDVLGYDYSLAISAPTKSSSSSSASDLEEFPMLADKQDFVDSDDASVSSSNVSSDISESSSGSTSDSSYDDSFISIVESEEESDLEFFDEQHGFAENFMSNLVSKTFGWFEKQQESLACGFKSDEVEGPSLLRESMTRQKSAEPDTVRENRNKEMKDLRSAVASKYGRVKSTYSAAIDSERRNKNIIGKGRHHNNIAAVVHDDRKKSKRAERSYAKRQVVKRERGSSLAYQASAEKLSEQTQGEQNVAFFQKNCIAEEKTKKSDTDSAHPLSCSPGESRIKKPKELTEDKVPPNKLLSSDDDDAESSSVQVIAVHPARFDGKKANRSTKAKIRKIETSLPEDDTDSIKIIVNSVLQKEDREEDVPRTSTPNAASSLEKNAKSSKSNNRRSANDRDKVAAVSSLSPPRDGTEPQKTISSDLNAAGASWSPPLQGLPRPADSKVKPNISVGHDEPEKVAAGGSTQRQPKDASSKGASKASKKSLEKDRLLEDSLRVSKRGTGRSRRRKGSENGRKPRLVAGDRHEEDETESDGDSIKNMLTEEERENARKERRRAAALKRRRKLREKRREKLEKALTDDTFS